MKLLLEGLCLIFKWEDLGLVFSLEQNSHLMPGWHDSHAQAPNAVIMSNFVRIYFCSRPKPEKDGNVVSIGMYVDVIPDEDFRIISISQNPLIELGAKGEFDEFGTYPISVLREGSDFTAIYGGWSRPLEVPFEVSLGLATSLDGVHFKKLGNGPIIGPNEFEPFVLTSPKIRKYDEFYVIAYTSGIRWFRHNGRMEVIYRIRIAFSTDKITWNRFDQEIIPTVLGDEEAQACPDIYFKDGLYHMFFCYRNSINFRLDVNNSYKLGYAYSSDLKNWTRKDGLSAINGESPEWCQNMQAYPNVFDYKGSTYMLYLGDGTGKYGFGAAKLVNQNDI
jgi:hypothetical protein